MAEEGLYGQELATVDDVGVGQLAHQLESLVARGVTPEVLSQYMDIWERTDARRAKAEFTTAMVDVQRNVPTVVKDAMNSHTRSKYARLETVQRAIKPVYIEHGFSVSFTDGVPPRDGWVRVIAIVRHEGGHTEEFHRDGPMDTKGAKGGDVKTELHGIQSTVSYMRRNLLCEIFGVTVAESDNDGGGPVERIDEKQAATIRDMLQEIGQGEGGFLKMMGVEKVEEIPTIRYGYGMDRLRRKLDEVRKGTPAKKPGGAK